jgi:Luciferase
MDNPEYSVEACATDNRGNEMSIADTIKSELLSWPGVAAEPHRFGGVEFQVNHHEIGHLHGSRLADLPFPVRVRNELVAAGRASPHHVLPDSGWVSFSIRGPEDVPAVLELFRMNYDRLTTSIKRET